MKPKILLTGPGGHGKDTATYPFRVAGYRAASSSAVMLDHAIWEQWAKFHYETKEHAFQDRRNNRFIWKGLIRQYNHPDPTRLARTVLAENDVYVGMRDRDEFEACRAAGLFDYVVYLYDPRKKDPGDCGVLKSDAHRIILNDGSIADCLNRANRVIRSIEAEYRKGRNEIHDTGSGDTDSQEVQKEG